MGLLNFRSALTALIVLATSCTVTAWSSDPVPRRSFVTSAAAAALAVNAPALAVDASLIDELRLSQEKLAPIPALLEEKKWDEVRSILKVPPVNKLWNLGDTQNTVLKLAKDTGNIDLFELKDDLAYNLQICDQLTYDNAFVYFQPGNGKVKIKEPQQLARQAISQIQEIIDMSTE